MRRLNIDIEFPPIVAETPQKNGEEKWSKHHKEKKRTKLEQPYGSGDPRGNANLCVAYGGNRRPPSRKKPRVKYFVFPTQYENSQGLFLVGKKPSKAL